MKISAEITEESFTEYHRIQENAGIFEMTHRGLLQISGTDSPNFLNRLLTNKISTISPNTGLYSALLQANGKIICEMHIHNIQNKFFIETAAEKVSELHDFLKARIFIEDIHIKILERGSFLTIQGPQSGKILEQIFTISLKGLEELQNTEIQHEGKNTKIIKIPRSIYSGYDLISEHNSPRLHKLFSTHGIKPYSQKTHERLRIEAGISAWGTEITESQTPYEANIEHALNFEKGCYIGQEVITRLKHRAKRPSKYRITPLILHTKNPPEPGTKIFAQENPAGQITSSTYSPKYQAVIALASLKRQLIETQAQFHIPSHDIHAKVHKTEVPS